MREIRCRSCGNKIEFGNSESLVDDDGHYFCDGDCALSYYEVTCIDWEEEKNLEYESNKSRESYYGAHFAKDGFITNGHYAILGVNVGDSIDDGYYVNVYRIKDQIIKMIKEVEAPEFTKLVKLSECKIVDNTDGHIKEQSRDVFIMILDAMYNKKYIDLIVELLGLSDSLIVKRKDNETPLVFICDNGSSAVVMPVLWEITLNI